MAQLSDEDLEVTKIGEVALESVCTCVEVYEGSRFSYDDCRNCGGTGLELTADGKKLLAFMKRRIGMALQE